MEIQPRDLSDRLGVKNSNKDTSEFLTLYPSLNIGGFRSTYGRLRAIPASFSCAIVRNCICNGHAVNKSDEVSTWLIKIKLPTQSRYLMLL